MIFDTDEEFAPKASLFEKRNMTTIHEVNAAYQNYQKAHTFEGIAGNSPFRDAVTMWESRRDKDLSVLIFMLKHHDGIDPETLHEGVRHLPFSLTQLAVAADGSTGMPDYLIPYVEDVVE